MATHDDLVRDVRNEIIARSAENVWVQEFDRQVDRTRSHEKLWREQPVDILTFAQDFLGRKLLSDFHRAAFEAFAGHDPEQWDETYTTIALCWGMGAGKNFTTEVLVAYTFYRLLCLSSPHALFRDLDPSAYIDVLNISFVREEQAKDVFFDSLKKVLRNTTDPATGRNWFADRGVDLRDGGIGDIKEKIIYLPRSIRARCLPFTEAAFEGGQILLGIIDEPSRAVTSPPANKKAHEIYSKMLTNSTTRFQRMGKMVVFSYPQAQDQDLIMELFNGAGTQFTAKGERKRPDGDPDTYGSMGATYEVNPRTKREDFDNLRRQNPERIETIIECNPPHSRTGFYRAYPEKVQQSFCLDPRRKVIHYEVVPATYPVQERGQLVQKTYTEIRFIGADGDDEFRVLGGDPGESSDIFALALARAEPAKRPIEVLVMRRERVQAEVPPGYYGPGHIAGEVHKEERLQLQVIDRAVVVDGLVEIVPIRYQHIDPKTGRTVTATYPISFPSVRDFVLKLKQHFPNLIAAAFDRWNSSDLVTSLVTQGQINAESLAFGNQEQFALYSQHRSLAYNDLIRVMPSPRAEKEFVDLQEVIPGRKVDHKPDGSKDVSDAIVIAAHLALDASIAGEGSFIIR
jgi:hypothetical protein